jgi:plastocyanin
MARRRRIAMSLRTITKVLAVAGIATVVWMVLDSAVAHASPPGATIVVKDFMFAPMSATITAGTTVTWVNEDQDPHTVVSDTGLFRSGAIDTNETFSFAFDKPGVYHFTCSIHPRMVGTVVVQ